MILYYALLFFRHDTKSMHSGRKKDVHQNLKLLHFKGFYQENENNTYNGRKYFQITCLTREGVQNKIKSFKVSH